MIDHGRVLSSVAPEAIEITEAKVFISGNAETITDIGENGEEITLHRYDLTEYGKDEYIALLSGRNDALEAELTDLQLALCEMYEGGIG